MAGAIVTVGSPLYRVAQALYEAMPEQWADQFELSAVPFSAASQETRDRFFDAARIAVRALRPVGDQVRDAGQAVSRDAVFAWTAMIDAILTYDGEVAFQGNRKI